MLLLKLSIGCFSFPSLNLFNRIEKKKNALKAADNSSESIKLMINRLVEIKYIHLIKTSLDIAKKVSTFYDNFLSPNPSR